MSPWVFWPLLLGCLVLSAVFSGSETGMYSLSRGRLDAEARSGRLGPRLLQRLLRREVLLLITLLVGNNAVLQAATLACEAELGRRGVAPGQRELLLALLLTPLVFLFGEVLPKDLFRRRPHRLMDLAAPVLWGARIVFAPLTLLLRSLTAALERLSGLEPDRLSREAWHGHLERLIEEGTRAGALPRDVEQLARNAMRLRAIPVEQAMVPWGRVDHLRADAAEAERRATVAATAHTRLPVLGADGRVASYVHQLDVLGGDPAAEVLSFARPLEALDPATPVHRAIWRLRATGQRVAVVGSHEAPRGLVTLKDLVEEISGELSSW